MLKSVALVGAVALGLMALPAQAAVTIFEGAAINLPVSNGGLKLSDMSLVAASPDKVQVDRHPVMRTASSNGKPFELPEPATWGMILAGLGTIGYTMRRQGLRDASFA